MEIFHSPTFDPRSFLVVVVDAVVVLVVSCCFLACAAAVAAAVVAAVVGMFFSLSVGARIGPLSTFSRRLQRRPTGP